MFSFAVRNVVKSRSHCYFAVFKREFSDESEVKWNLGARQGHFSSFVKLTKAFWNSISTSQSHYVAALNQKASELLNLRR